MKIVLFIIVIAVMFAIGHFGEPILRKKLGIKPREIGTWYKERILMILFFLSVTTQDLKTNILLILIGFIVTLNIFRSFMEWKYTKESREYLLTIFAMFYLVIFLPGMIYLL